MLESITLALKPMCVGHKRSAGGYLFDSGKQSYEAP